MPTEVARLAGAIGAPPTPRTPGSRRGPHDDRDGGDAPCRRRYQTGSNHREILRCRNWSGDARPRPGALSHHRVPPPHLRGPRSRRARGARPPRDPRPRRRIWAWNQARSSTPVSEEAAVAAFRREGRGGGGSEAPGIPRTGRLHLWPERIGERRGRSGRPSPGTCPPTRATSSRGFRGGYAEELHISQEHIEGLRLREALDGGSRAVSRRTKVSSSASAATIGATCARRRSTCPPICGWAEPGRADTPPATCRCRSAAGCCGGSPSRSRGAGSPGVVVSTVGDTGGAHPGTRTDTRWWSPALALPRAGPSRCASGASSPSTPTPTSGWKASRREHDRVPPSRPF